MKLDKKSVFYLGACYGALVTVGVYALSQVSKKLIDKHIEKKVRATVNPFDPFSSGVNSGFGSSMNMEEPIGDFNSGCDDSFFEEKDCFTSENKEEK